MIGYKDISKFFNQEAEAARSRWEALMKLPLKDRIRKRKAIGPVYLDKEYEAWSEEDKKLLKVTFEKNLSDFKEGDSVLLHKEDVVSGIKCNVNRFEGDNTLIIEVYSGNLPNDSYMCSYYDTPLCLDKDIVDLRQSVYSNFLSELPRDKDFWKNNLLNTKASPVFKDKKEFEKDIDDVVNVELLPRQREAIINSLAAEDYYLIQGPPGTGKSFVLSLIILEEMFYLNHKVIVIGPNHMAINNTLIRVLKSCPINVLKVGQSYNAPDFKMIFNDKELKINNILNLNSAAANESEFTWVIGLTPYSLYTRRAWALECDTLIVDEAGQMTIPLTLMGTIRAKKVIFAGDYKQLPPIISSDEVCGGLKQSVFQSLITDSNCTMLDVSFRMCESICNFVSELFYDGQLKPVRQGCGNAVINDNPLYSFDAPIVIHNIEDFGEQTSDTEAEFIAGIIDGYLSMGLSASEIAVLTPFRAQAACVRRHVRKNESISDGSGEMLAIDTVDKMQGQEREIIILSLAAGNVEYMTEMADFLYNPNKLNVAFSRAKSKLIIVGNIGSLKQMDFETYPHLEKILNSQYIKLV